MTELGGLGTKIGYHCFQGVSDHDDQAPNLGKGREMKSLEHAREGKRQEVFHEVLGLFRQGGHRFEKGPIGIQLHGNRDMQIDYRKIRIGELSD